MFTRKKLTAISAAVMLGISTVTVVVPVANADVIGSAGVLGGGEFISRADIEYAERDYVT